MIYFGFQKGGELPEPAAQIVILQGLIIGKDKEDRHEKENQKQGPKEEERNEAELSLQREGLKVHFS
jgi:hypothetical protein